MVSARRVRAGAAAAIAALVPSISARADERATVPAASAMDASLLTYYEGERNSAFVVMGLGAAGIGAGAVLATRRGDFDRGLGWPLLTLGALQSLGGVFYVSQVDAEIRHYRALLAADPLGYQKAEAAHLDGTRRRFVFYRLAEAGLAVAGAAVATYGFAAKRATYEGVGVGGLAVGVPFLIIDTINNRRAGWYAEKLRRFQPSVGVGRADVGHGWSFVLAGSL